MDRNEVPTFESIFVDGRVAVGSTGSMLTAVYDESLISENNPVSTTTRKMPFEHAALRITAELLTKLAGRSGPPTVRIVLHPGSVDWVFGDRTIVVNDIISHPEDYDFDDEDENQSDYYYPGYRELIARVVDEVDKLEEPIAFDDAAAFSVPLGLTTMSTILKIASILGEPSHNIDGSWREGEAASIIVSGGTPHYHIVRYCTLGGYLRTNILSIIGARSNKNLGTSTVEMFPEFALKDGCDRPTSIWDTFTDDGATDSEDDDDDSDDDELVDLSDEGIE